MWNRETISEKVIDALKETGFDEVPLTLTTNLYDDLDVDSIDVVDLRVNLEESFEIILNEDDIRAIQTVEDVVSMIEQKLQNPA